MNNNRGKNNSESASLFQYLWKLHYSRHASVANVDPITADQTDLRWFKAELGSSASPDVPALLFFGLKAAPNTDKSFMRWVGSSCTSKRNSNKKQNL